jgi:hypothetical protein
MQMNKITWTPFGPIITIRNNIRSALWANNTVSKIHPAICKGRFIAPTADYEL